MIELTGTQRRHLNSVGHKLPCAAAIGNEGLSDEFIRHVDELFNQHELLKIRLPDISAAKRGECIAKITQTAKAICVGVVGRVAMIYRPFADPEKPGRIQLPD
ncbi:MAG: YhbY family RNA-binding protein [Planctomycetes bacterium]|nr:YhbY family RNA-binding protein [Planctomycetota bacterium]